MSLDSGVAAGTLEMDGFAAASWPALGERQAQPLEPRARREAAAEFESEALPHLRALRATAYRLTRSVADAEDLVQETCLRAYRAWATYTPGTNVRAWLYTILYRARTDMLRRKGRTVVTVELEGEGPAVAAPQEALASGHEDLDRALLALPEVFRSAVILRDVEELSYDEVARVLGVPIGTVMSRIHRGRGLLRKLLAK